MDPEDLLCEFLVVAGPRRRHKVTDVLLPATLTHPLLVFALKLALTRLRLDAVRTAEPEQLP